MLAAETFTCSSQQGYPRFQQHDRINYSRNSRRILRLGNDVAALFGENRRKGLVDSQKIRGNNAVLVTGHGKEIYDPVVLKKIV